MNKRRLKQLESDKWTPEMAAILLRRASFGGSPEEVQMCHKYGMETAVQFILEGKQPGHTGKMETERLRPPELKTMPTLPRSESSSSQAQATTAEKNLVRMQNEWLNRMLSAAAPKEKMVLFWHGMLTSSYRKTESSQFMIIQNQLFRDHAFGSYLDLVKKIIVDPAMVMYLDIDKNTRSNPNENFARELLELFTLGEGNYKPEEIKLLAKKVVGFQARKPARDSVEFEEKEIRKMFAYAGYTDAAKRASKVVGELADKAIFGELVCKRLWRYYVSTTENPAAIKAMYEKLRESKWQIKPMLYELFTSEVFFKTAHEEKQIKCPVQYIVQGHKELGLKKINVDCAYYMSKKLGQNLLNPPNVAGWPAGETWINGTTISGRYELSLLMADKMSAVKNPVSAHFYNLMAKDKMAGLSALVGHFIAVDFSVEKARMLIKKTKEVNSQADVQKLIEYMMCMPEYQLC